MKTILLASQSPRRKKILKFVGIPFKVIKPTGVIEEIKKNEKPIELVRRLAISKALYVSKKNKKYWVIAADTVVVFENKIFGKPKNFNEAFKMLASLQGKPHEVWTGTAWVGQGGKRVKFHAEKTKIFFKTVSKKDLSFYLKSKEPYDKAGGYDIQGTARNWIGKWEGDYFNVMGLPIRWVSQQIKIHG